MPLFRMLTKTQIKVMQVFAASITKSFRSTDVSRILGIDNKNVRVALKTLAEEGFLRTNHNLYSLNYGNNHQKLAYIENLRSEEFLKKKKNAFVRLFVEDALKKIQSDSFILIVFGSTVDSPKPADTDVLVIADTKEQADEAEKALHKVISKLKPDINAHWHESVYDMLEKRDGKNLMIRVLDRHLIFHGAETFYRLLAKGRR